MAWVIYLKQFISRMKRTFGIVLTCLLISNFIVAVVLLKTDDGSTLNAMAGDNWSMDGIFGVRWRLGDAYALQQINQNNEYYVLNFNSHHSLNAQTYVKFKDSWFACAEQRHSSQNFTTYIHTCRVNQKLSSPYEYQIVSREVQIAGEDNHTHIESNHQTVRYEGKLRADNLGESILILGDLFFDESGTLLCELASILERNNISMVVIGNVYPAINQDNYDRILTMLQPVTSQVMTVSVNELNPSQSVLPSLLFPLSQSALENYYNIISINQFNLTILTVNSNLNVSQIISGLSEQEKERMKGGLFLQISSIPSIGDSILYQPIRADLQLYTENDHSFSKRTLCGDFIPSQMDDQSKRKMCPLIIVEGRIDMANQMQNYGILHFQVTPSYNKLSFDHYSQCLPSDHIEFKYNQIDQQAPPQPDDKLKSQIRHIIIAAQYIAIVSLSLFILITYLIHRKKASGLKKAEQKHVELVQEIVGGSLPAQK